VGESPTAAYSAVDPSIGAPDRMSGMGKCQTVKAGVLSRWRSPVFGQGEGWHRDSPVGRSGVEACSVLQPREFGRLRPGSECQGLKDRSPSGVKGGAASLPARMWDWLSGDVPDARLGRWPNKPLQGHRVAIVSVACQKAGKPRGLKAQWLYATCLTGLG